MSASDQFDPSQRPRGQSAGDAMLRRRFARQLGLEAEAPARAEPARIRPPEPPPFMGPAPQGAQRPDRQAPDRQAPERQNPDRRNPDRQNPDRQNPGHRNEVRPPRPEARRAPLSETPYRADPSVSRAPEPSAEPAAPAPQAAPAAAPEAPPARTRSFEEEFLAAFSDDPPEAALGADEDFLSEFAREPEPERPAPPPERSAPAAEQTPSSGSTIRRALEDAPIVARGKSGVPAKTSAAKELADGRKRSREFALNFERLRKFGFITPSARRSRLSEEIRLIKRRLIRRMTLEETGRRPGQMRSRAPRGRQHVILFTSAKPSEGKSFVAVNLALSIILDEGLNVLLVDADAARPSLSKILGLKPNLKGLTDLLEEARHGRSDVSGRMLRTPDHPLTFIPAGEAVESATDLYGGDAMRSLMADLADRYSDRIILIDGPPLLASTEPVELARHAGQVVMVVDAERTTRKAVEAALDLLGPECNVNLVLNKATASGRLEQFGSYYEAYANDSAPRKS